MRLTVARLGRFWQYVGVALLAHVATTHGTVWGNEIATEAEVASSGIRFLTGVGVAVILFWLGIYLEGRGVKANEPAAKRI